MCPPSRASNPLSKAKIAPCPTSSRAVDWFRASREGRRRGPFFHDNSWLHSCPYRTISEPLHHAYFHGRVARQYIRGHESMRCWARSTSLLSPQRPESEHANSHVQRQRRHEFVASLGAVRQSPDMRNRLLFRALEEVEQEFLPMNRSAVSLLRCPTTGENCQ